MRKSYLLFMGFILIFASGCASLKNAGFVYPGEASLPIKLGLPADTALDCHRRLVEERGLAPPTVAVVAIKEKSGKLNTNGDGPGAFLGQDPAGAFIAGLHRAGIPLAERSAEFREVFKFDYDASKVNISDSQPITGTLERPDVYAMGAIDKFDLLPGGGIDASIFGFGLKGRVIGAFIGGYVRAVSAVTGRVVAFSALDKIILGKEWGANVARVFGEALVLVDFGAMRREAPDVAVWTIEGFMAYDIATQLTGLLECDKYTQGVFPKARKVIIRKKFIESRKLPKISLQPTPLEPKAQESKARSPDLENIGQEVTKEVAKTRRDVDRNKKAIDQNKRAIDQNNKRIKSLNVRTKDLAKSVKKLTTSQLGNLSPIVFVRFKKGNACCPHPRDIQEIKQLLSQGYSVEKIVGFSSPGGDPADNAALRQARALAVKQILGVEVPAFGAGREELKALHQAGFVKAGVFVRLERR